MANRTKSRVARPPPSMAELQFKLTRIVSRHDQMKIAFNQLKSQIKTGLFEAEDVFASLAIPLTRLVGLKTVEMAEEGRFSTIFMDADSNSQGLGRKKTPSTVERGDHHHQIPRLQEDSYSTKASMAGKELIQKQRSQLTQLVHLLRQIETQVNSSQNNILHTLYDHRTAIHKFFQRAATYVSALNQSSQNNESFLVTLKLLRAAFDHVGAALGSVEDGVEDLMHDLAEQMCIPMVEYVKGLKTEMNSGTCPRLLAIVEEMGGAIRDGRAELEKARKNVRKAEERKLEAISRLKESEERASRMKECLEYFKTNNGSREHFSSHKRLGVEEDQAKDEKLFWELLKKKRKCQVPESPLGPKELLSLGAKNKHFKSAISRISISHRPVSRSYLQGLGPQTPSLGSWLPLGSSPSAAPNQVLSRKRVTP